MMLYSLRVRQNGGFSVVGSTPDQRLRRWAGVDPATARDRARRVYGGCYVLESLRSSVLENKLTTPVYWQMKGASGAGGIIIIQEEDPEKWLKVSPSPHPTPDFWFHSPAPCSTRWFSISDVGSV